MSYLEGIRIDCKIYDIGVMIALYGIISYLLNFFKTSHSS